MKCPWCSQPVTQVSAACPECGHEFHVYLQRRIAAVLRVEGHFNELAGIAKRAGEAADALRGEIEALGLQIEEEARSAKETDAAGPSPDRSAAASPSEDPDGPVSGIKPLAPASREGTGTSRSPGLEAILGQKWLPIIGVVTVIFGVGYFLKYAMDQGWVNPLQRILSACALSAVFIGGGHHLRRRGYAAYGLIVMGGGLAALYFSTFAAYHLYNLIDRTPVFLVMFLITLAAGALSVYYSNMWLAVLGLFGGYFTPLMLSTGGNNYWFLFIYLGILGAGVLGIAYTRRWPILHYLGFIGTFGLYGLWYDRHFDESPFWPAFIFLSIYFLAYGFVPFAYRFFRAPEPKDGKVARADVSLIILNSFVAFGLSYSMISARYSSESASVAAFFYAAAFASMTWVTFRKLQNHPGAFGVFAANTGLFFAVGTALLFSRHWVTFFWAVQAAGLFLVALRIGDRGLLRKAAVTLMCLAYLKLFRDYMDLGFSTAIWGFAEGYTHNIASRAVLVIGILVSLGAMVIGMRRYSPESVGKHRSEITLGTVLSWAFGLMLFYLLNIETAAFFHDYLPTARFAAISVLWTAFSAGLMVLGFRRWLPSLRKLSIGLFLVTLLKVFLVDISNMDTPYRILSFIVLGIVLVGVSYLYHRFHDRLALALGGADANKKTG